MDLTKPISEKTAQEIENEIKRLIAEGEKLAHKVIMENKDKITQLAEIILEREVMFTEDVEQIFGKSHRDKKKDTARPDSENEGGSASAASDAGDGYKAEEVPAEKSDDGDPVVVLSRDEVEEIEENITAEKAND